VSGRAHWRPASRIDPFAVGRCAEIPNDSGNPYDSRAVAIWVGGQHVGYLDRDTARIWHPTVAGLAALDRHLTLPSRVWASTARGTMSARVTLYAPACDAVRPANELPEEPHVVLPVGSTIQVTKEGEHMDVLSAYAAGGEKPIAVTLHAIHEIRPRSAFETVEVRLDGERVGILTPTQAGNLLPLVKHVEDRGQVPVARATLKGTDSRRTSRCTWSSHRTPTLRGSTVWVLRGLHDGVPFDPSTSGTTERRGRKVA